MYEPTRLNISFTTNPRIFLGRFPISYASPSPSFFARVSIYSALGRAVGVRIFQPWDCCPLTICSKVGVAFAWHHHRRWFCIRWFDDWWLNIKRLGARGPRVLAVAVSGRFASSFVCVLCTFAASCSTYRPVLKYNDPEVFIFIVSTRSLRVRTRVVLLLHIIYNFPGLSYQYPFPLGHPEISYS